MLSKIQKFLQKPSVIFSIMGISFFIYLQYLVALIFFGPAKTGK